MVRKYVSFSTKKKNKVILGVHLEVKENRVPQHTLYPSSHYKFWKPTEQNFSL